VPKVQRLGTTRAYGGMAVPKKKKFSKKIFQKKKLGKKIVGSDDDAGRKKSTLRNHGIHFKDDKQRSRYKSLISKLISACRYPDANAMDKLGKR
jgi:hypothetical protein